MTKERVYLHSCELLIDSFLLHVEPQYDQLYFLWKKGKKFSKSNTYDIATNSLISIKQKLQLGLKIYSKNGKYENKNTHLYLLFNDGKGPKEESEKQLCQFILAVNDWGISYQKIQLQIKQSNRVVGLINLQVKKREVMELQNFHRFTGQIQQSSEGESTIMVMNTSGRGLQSETIKLQKQIEDYKYLNEKLKKDRGFLISRNEVLQKEIRSIKSVIDSEMKRMEVYYQNKLQIHSRIYQEEIQSLITTFNETSNTNSIIMKSIVNENQQLAGELEQLRITAEEQLEKQNNYYKGKLSQANDQRQRVQQVVQDLQLKIGDLEKELLQSNRKYEMTKQQFDLLTINSEVQRKQSNLKYQSYEKHLETQRKQISDLKNQISQKIEELKKQKQDSAQLRQDLTSSKQILENYKIQQIKLENQLNEKRENIVQLKRQREQNLEFIQKLQKDYKKYIDDSEKTNTDYQKQLQQLQSQSKQKQIQFERLISEQRNRLYSESAKLSQYISRYDDLQKDVIVKNEEIKTYIDENTKLNEQFLEEHTKVLQYEQENRQFLNEIEQLKITNETNEDKINLMTEELDNAYKKNHEDMEVLRENFEQSMRTREKYYEDEIQNLKAKLQNSQSSYNKLSLDFRGEIEQYKFLMEKTQQQQLQSIKQMNDLSNNNRRLQEENKQFETLLNEARLSMKQREMRFEQTLKLYQGGQIGKNRFDPVSSIDYEIQSRLQNKNSLLNPQQRLSIQIPQIGRNYQTEEQQKQYLRQVQALGSLEHIRYLISVEQINKDNLKQLERLEREIQKYKLEKQEGRKSVKKNQNEISELKEQVEKLTEIIEELKQELRYYLKKQQQVKSISGVHIEIDDDLSKMNNESFRSDRQEDEKKKFEDKSVQDSREKKSLTKQRSRISKGFSFMNGKDAEVQVQIISLVQINNYEQQIQDLLSDARARQENQERQRTGSNNEEKSRVKKSKVQSKLSASEQLMQFPPIENKELVMLRKKNESMQRKVEQIQQQILEKAEQLRLKQTRIQKLQSRNKQLFEQLTNFKQQIGIKVSMQQSKLLQYSELTKRQEGEYNRMRQTILQKDNQLKTTQQNLTNHINTLKSQIQKLLSENTKLKKESEDRNNTKRGYGMDYGLMMQQDMQDANKRIIQLTRLSNQIRMEKQSLQDELKIMKKKSLETEKYMSTMNDKKIMAEQQIQNLTRKLNKTKRDLQDRQIQANKSKDQIKKMQQQLNNHGIVSSQALVERKKYLQQKFEFEEELNKRESEIRKLTKQLQKLRQGNDEIKQLQQLSKKQQKKKVSDLESECLKNRKLNIELEEQVSQLLKKNNSIEEQNRAKIEQHRIQYKEKLNMMMNDITEIKKLLDVNNEQKNSLQEQNFSLREQLQGFSQELQKISKQKAQLIMDRSQFENQINSNIRDLEEIKKQLMHYQEDNIDLHNRVASLSDELRNEQMLSARKSEKVQQYESLSQKYEYELRNLKNLLKQEKNFQETEEALRKQIRQLKEELQLVNNNLMNLQKEHWAYTETYKYSGQQMQELVSELQENYEQAHRKDLAATKDELDQQYESKNVKREKQILELYNENAKYRVQMKRKQDEYGQLLQKYEQIGLVNKKYNKIKQQHDRIAQQLTRAVERANRDQSKWSQYQLDKKQLEMAVSQLKSELNLIKNALTNEKSKSNRLESELIQLQTAYSITKQQLKKISLESRRQIEVQSTQLQDSDQKILSLELQNMRVKQREENMHKQYKQQIRKLESKVNSSISQLQQKNTTLQRQYKAKLAEKDRVLKEMNRSINSLQADFSIVKQQMNGLKKQNEDLASELSTTRQQMSEDQEIYILEINKLKNSIREGQQIYNYNVNALEEQLAELNKQLIVEQLNSRQKNGLSVSRLRESEIERRFDEKCKNKDSKIQQLKKNIFILEQTVTSLKRKIQLDGHSQNAPSEKYRTLYNELVVQIQSLNKKHQLEITTQQQTIRQLKKQLFKAKQTEDDLMLQADQKDLMLHSLQCELTTIKEIYQTLQKQLEKRQIKLIDNVSISASFEKQIEENSNRIRSLEQESLQKQNLIENLKLAIKARDQQLMQIKLRLQTQATTVPKISHLNMDSKKIVQIQQSEINSLKQELSRAVKQNKKLSDENETLRRNIKSYEKSEREYKKMQLDYIQLGKKAQQNEDMIGKYVTVDEKSKQMYGIGVEQLVLGGFIQQKIFDQQQQVNTMRQELQQLRFTQQRRKMDTQQLLKQNLSLKLRGEDYEIMQDQVQTLRKICDKLEEEKKIAVLREEAVRIRLANLIGRNQPKENIRDCLEAILNYNHVYV